MNQCQISIQCLQHIEHRVVSGSIHSCIFKQCCHSQISENTMCIVCITGEYQHYISITDKTKAQLKIKMNKTENEITNCVLVNYLILINCSLTTWMKSIVHLTLAYNQFLKSVTKQDCENTANVYYVFLHICLRRLLKGRQGREWIQMAVCFI